MDQLTSLWNERRISVNALTINANGTVRAPAELTEGFAKAPPASVTGPTRPAEPPPAVILGPTIGQDGVALAFQAVQPALGRQVAV